MRTTITSYAKQILIQNLQNFGTVSYRGASYKKMLDVKNNSAYMKF